MLSSNTLGKHLVFQSVLMHSDCVVLDNQRLIYSWKLYLLPSTLAFSNNRSLDNCELSFNYYESMFATSRLSISISSFINSIESTGCSSSIINTYLSSVIDNIIEDLKLLIVVRVGYQSDVSLKSMSSKIVTLKNGDIIPIILATTNISSTFQYSNENLLVDLSSDDIYENAEFYIDASHSFDIDFLDNSRQCDMRDYNIFNIDALKKFALLYPVSLYYISVPLFSDCFSFIWECASYLGNSLDSPVPCHDKDLYPLNITSFMFNTSSLKFPAFTFLPGIYDFNLKIVKGHRFSSKSFKLSVLSLSLPKKPYLSLHSLTISKFSIFADRTNLYILNDRPLYLESSFLIDCNNVGDVLVSWTFSPAIFNSSIWVKPSLGFQSNYFTSTEISGNYSSVGSEFPFWMLVSSSNITLNGGKCFVNLSLQISLDKVNNFLDSSVYFNISNSVYIFNEIISVASSSLLIPHKFVFGCITSFPSFGLSFKTPFTFTINEIVQDIASSSSSYDRRYQFFLLSKSLPKMFWSSWATTQYEFSLFTFSDVTSFPIFPISAESNYFNLHDVNYRIPLNYPSSFSSATFKLPPGLLTIEGCVSSSLVSSSCFITSVFVADNSQTYYNESLTSVLSDTQQYFNNTFANTVNLQAFASTSSKIVDAVYDLFSGDVLPTILIPYCNIPIGQVFSINNLFSARNSPSDTYLFTDLDTSKFVSLSLFKTSLLDSFTYSIDNNFNRNSINLEDEILLILSNWNKTKDLSI